MQNAYLVNTNTVRSVRVGGNWNNGANDGFSAMNGNNYPSNGNANYGSGRPWPHWRAMQMAFACDHLIKETMGMGDSGVSTGN